MNIKTLAMAAAIAFAAVTGANATQPTNVVSGGSFDTQSSFATDWKPYLSVFTPGNGGSGSAKIGNNTKTGIISQIFTVATGGFFNLSYDFKAFKDLTVKITDAITNDIVFQQTQNANSKGTDAGPLDPFKLDEGQYTLSFLSKNAIVDNVSLTGSTTAVPGPEAGAGIGALAMGGVAVWAARRRRDNAVAA